MRNICNQIRTRWAGMFIFALITIITTQSCNDDEDGKGMPVIHYLRVTNPELADSTFTDVNPGTMIAVIGENLSGVKEVYVNSQEISFNSNYNTNTSLIITIPADENFLLAGPNPEIPSELRIVTNHGIATHPMHVLSPGPVISSISAFYPIEPGDEISLVGEHFYEIKRLYFTEDSINVTQVITDYQISEDFERLTFNVPDKLMAGGYIIMECYTSDACIEFIPEGPQAVITGISSTMPIAGSEVVIRGKNLINVSRININGEFNILQTDITTSPAYDEVSFILPQKPTRPGTLSLTTISGTVEMPGIFYPTDNIVLDWDNAGSYIWGGYSQVWPAANGEEVPYISDGNYSGIVGTLTPNEKYWWGQTVNSTVWPSADIIPTGTPVSELELQFECYITEALDGPVLQIQLGGNFDASLQNYVPVSSLTGEMEIGKWMQCSVPLTSLIEENTWGSFLNRTNPPGEDGSIPSINQLGIYITSPNCTSNEYIEIYVDNFRIIPIQQPNN